MTADPAPRRRRSALPPLAAVLGACLPAALVLASGATLAWRDTSRLLGSMRPAIEADLRALALPLWQPHEALGLPLLAQLMHGVLHPVSLAAAFLAPGASMDLQIVLHLALAAGGAWLLARALGATPWGAAVAGLAYGLSGYVLGMSCVLTYLAGASTAPWAVAGLRLAGARARGGVLLSALGAAALVLGGDPQWTIVALLLGGALALEAGGWRGGARAALAGSAGLLLAGVQLVPALAFLPETARAGAVAGWERALWDLPPWRVAELILPGLFNGVPGSGIAPVFVALGGEVGRHTTSFVPSVFVGLVPLALARRALGGSRTAAVVAGGAAVSLWLALGVNAGADQLLGGVPVWGAFRYSEKLAGPLALCLAVLAGLGADRARGAAAGGRAALALGAILLAAVALAAWPGSAAGLGTLVGGDAAEPLRVRLLAGLAHALGAAALLAALAAVAARRPAWAGPAAAAAVALQSGAASLYALHAGSRDAVERRPLAALRGEAGPVRVATPVTGSPLLPRPDLDAADRLAAFQSRLGVAPYPTAAGIDQLDCYSGFAPAAFDRFSTAVERDLGARHWAAWRRLSSTHVAAPRALAPDQLPGVAASVEGGEKVLADEATGFSVWAVPHRPWASFAEGVLTARDEQEAYATFAAATALGNRDVVLEGPAPAGTFPGRVLAWERRGGRVRIVAEAGGPALLVVNDAHWPGWEATIDGAPVPILRADVLVRAVPFPPGRHVLEMRYAPPEVTAGLAVSAAGLAVLAALLALARRRAARA